MKRLVTWPGLTYLFLRRVRKRTLAGALRPLSRKHGRSFRFDPDSYFSYETITVGDDGHIGPGVPIGVKSAVSNSVPANSVVVENQGRMVQTSQDSKWGTPQ